jgi:hypothetical protein
MSLYRSGADEYAILCVYLRICRLAQSGVMATPRLSAGVQVWPAKVRHVQWFTTPTQRRQNSGCNAHRHPSLCPVP